MPSRKRKDLKLRKALKQEPCAVCGSVPSDPCHIKTFKVSQSDHPANIISMCRVHHNEQHKQGWPGFLQKYPAIFMLLIELGWDISRHPFDGGRIILVHPEVA